MMTGDKLFEAVLKVAKDSRSVHGYDPVEHFGK
jgi:hypothetical protein